MFAHRFTPLKKLMVLLVAVVVALACAPLSSLGATGTVTGSVLIIREGPGSIYAKKGSLLKGAQVNIVGQKSAWLNISLKSGLTGWVHSDYVKISGAISNSAPPANNATGTQATGTVTGSVVNLRAGPGTQYSKKASVTKGVKVAVIGQSSPWLNVRLGDGTTGWLHSDYVQVETATPASPSSTSGTVTASKVEVTGNTVNLRQGPGISYRAQGQVKKGDQLPLLGHTQGWYQVQTSRGVAYLAGWLARVLTPETANAGEITPSPTLPAEPTAPGSGADPGGDSSGNSSGNPNGNTDPQNPEVPASDPVLPPSVTRVVLDPGHGGIDSGAIGYSGSYEKEVNLSIARKTVEILRSAGLEVLLTRDDDRYVALSERVDFANSAQATVMVSIHCNGTTRSDKMGTSVYYYIDQDNPAIVAQAVERERLARIMQDSLLRQLGRPDDGVRQNNFVVVRYTLMPSILIETAYLTNPGEEVLLNDPAFQDQAAQAIAQGIMEYLSTAGSSSAIN